MAEPSEELASELVSVCRTTVGDELRSITYFTRDTASQVYLRSDLEASADLDVFAENERLGFRMFREYDGTELGDYKFTIRDFEHGYLTRVIVGDHGTFVTTDEMSIDRFEELATAVQAVLAAHEAAA